jgi:hypothetical protein
MKRRKAQPVGRPRTMIDGRRVTVYLDEPTLRAAAALGHGIVSAGIRHAIAIALAKK